MTLRGARAGHPPPPALLPPGRARAPHLLAGLLWLALAWDASPDPGVTYYRLAWEMHYRFDVACPILEDPDRTCPVYTPGARTEIIVPDSACGARCTAPTVALPEPGRGETLWFQLVAGRASGCEGQTAWPPVP